MSAYSLRCNAWSDAGTSELLKSGKLHITAEESPAHLPHFDLDTTALAILRLEIECIVLTSRATHARRTLMTMKMLKEVT